MNISDMSGLELAQAIKNKEVSATEVLDQTLARIAEFPQVGAFAHLTEELARHQAAAVEDLDNEGTIYPPEAVPKNKK